MIHFSFSIWFFLLHFSFFAEATNILNGDHKATNDDTYFLDFRSVYFLRNSSGVFVNSAIFIFAWCADTCVLMNGLIFLVIISAYTSGPSLPLTLRDNPHNEKYKNKTTRREFPINQCFNAKNKQLWGIL